MPYRSKKQAAFIHAEAARGTPWAQKFVRDAHGTHVQENPKKKAIRRHLKKRRKHKVTSTQKAR